MISGTAVANDPMCQIKTFSTQIESLKLQGNEVGARIAASTFNLHVPSTTRRAGQMAVLLNGDWLR